MSIWVGVSLYFEGIYFLHLQGSTLDVCSTFVIPSACTHHNCVTVQRPVAKRDKISELVKWRAARHGRLKHLTAKPTANSGLIKSAQVRVELGLQVGTKLGH